MRHVHRLTIKWLLPVVVLFSFILTGAAVSAEGTAADSSAGSTVYVIDADRSVESGLYQHLKRAYKEAEEAKASRVLLVLNTLGGRVDSALNIGELIRGSKVPTTAFVEGKAVSAGTYIALNAQQIVMQPGSTIGAAAVVDGSGTLIDNPKTISFWTEEMKSAALLNDRDPDIAAAMVNPSLVVELKELGRTKEKGDVLTLSAQDAVKAGYAEYTAATVEDALDGLKLNQPNVVTYGAERAREDRAVPDPSRRYDDSADRRHRGHCNRIHDSGLRSPRHHRDDRVHSLFLRPLRIRLRRVRGRRAVYRRDTAARVGVLHPELRHPRHTGRGLVNLGSCLRRRIRNPRCSRSSQPS